MSTYRYNGIISRVKKRRLKRSRNEKPQRQHKKRKKHRGRKKRQSETITYDLGKRNYIIKHSFLNITNIKMLNYDIALINYIVFVELVIQRRSASKSYGSCDSSPCVDTYFDKSWSEYKSGFGSLSSDYWIGLEELYNLTNTQGKVWGLEVMHQKEKEMR